MTTRERVFKTALIAQAALKPGERVLDLACGTATLTLMAKREQPRAEIVAFDGDPQILQIARGKAHADGADIRFEQGLSTQLPYGVGSFDKVICSLFFHHLDGAAKRQTFGEIARVLKPDGELHVADWGRAANAAMRIAFLPIQLLDGFANTAENVAGALPEIMRLSGFDRPLITRNFSTLFGTLSLYSARRSRSIAAA